MWRLLGIGWLFLEPEPRRVRGKGDNRWDVKGRGAEGKARQGKGGKVEQSKETDDGLRCVSAATGDRQLTETQTDRCA